MPATTIGMQKKCHTAAKETHKFCKEVDFTHALEAANPATDRNMLLGQKCLIIWPRMGSQFPA